MKNALVKLAKTLVVLAIFAAAFIGGQHFPRQNSVVVEGYDATVTRNVQVYLLAQALHGEAKGHPGEWETLVSAIVNRMNDKRWEPTDLVPILLYKCEIVALCDDVPEDLTSEGGQKAYLYAEQVVDRIVSGNYVPSHNAHSWATPAAAAKDKWFKKLCLVTSGSGHGFYKTCPPKIHTATSLLPRPKPKGKTSATIRLASN